MSSCSRDDEQRVPIDGHNRLTEHHAASLGGGIQNMQERHTMNFKANAVMSYEYEASATPPALAYGQTSATSIIRSGNLVYIGWHTHDPANYNGFAKYSGAVSCYEVNGGNWTQVAQLDFNEMDIHEIALGGPNELYIVGQSNPDASNYSGRWGHRGAIIGKVQLNGSGHPVAAGYIEKPLTAFGANSISYISSSEIYTGTGAYGGHLYKLDANLNVLDSTFLNNVKSISANDLSGKIGVLRGNRGRQNIMAKFYEFNIGGALPAESAGIDLPGITTFIHERNEGDYYDNIYLSSANQGLVEIDPSGPTVSTVYNAGRTIGVAADELNEVIYVAAQQDGLKVLHGTGTADEYDLIGTFAPPSINNGNWYVGDVVFEGNNVFLTSGANNVIFTKIYPDYYSPSNANKLLYLRGGDPANWTVPGNAGSQSIAIAQWQAEGFDVTTMNFSTTITENLLRDYGAVVINGYFNEGRGLNPYPASEGSALYNWVNAGGKMLAVSSFSEQNHLYSSFGLSRVSRNLHTNNGNQEYFGSPLITTGFDDFSGAGNFSMASESMDKPLLTAGSPLTVMVTRGSDPALAYGQVGDGKVVISFTEGWLHDVSFPLNAWKANINQEDNLLILNNIIDYLK